MSEGTLFRASREIISALEAKGIKYTTRTAEKMSTVRVAYSGENFSSLEISFISTDDDNDVAVRAWAYIPSVPKAKRPQVQEVVNAMNAKFRYVKFVLDEEDVNMEFDFPVRVTNVGDIATEIISRFTNIADEAYPEFMKAMWA